MPHKLNASKIKTVQMFLAVKSQIIVDGNKICKQKRKFL